MWFLVATLILYGSTFQLDRWGHWALPDVTLWSWWTFTLYVCGVAAATGTYRTLPDRLMGLFGFCLVILYYRVSWDTFIKFLPTDMDNPDLWPMIFLAVNLLGPLLLITVGLLAPAVQIPRRR